MAQLKDRKAILSTLWIFAVLNYIYADLFGLFFNPVLQPDVRMEITQGSALAVAVLMETAIAMVLVSRVLTYGVNRWANIIVGVIHTVLVSWSLSVTTPTLFYAFFAIIEIACTLFVIWYPWTWRLSVSSPGVDELESAGRAARDHVTAQQ
ncbi:MAG TPA: DUF6326 family protein [Chloroflexota bacterium]|jgi:hypothetical protein